MKNGNTIIGNPEDSKYGFTREQMIEGYKMLPPKGKKVWHTYNGSIQ
jgi:diaminopimelate decarboxylase